MKTSAEPLGAVVESGGTRFGSYSTRADGCALRLFSGSGATLDTIAMQAQGNGYFALELAGIGHGARYKFVLDGRELPDPYARFLPDGVHGPAMVWQSQYEWRHGRGVSRSIRQHVIYELHVGTFTQAGTYAAAVPRLAALAELGVTAIELMPLCAFAGRRGWGYDGVAHFAPFAPYGDPDELRRFIDEAHGLGLSVLLDVVYNHFGPAGNYLTAYSDAYFTKSVQNAWGDAPDYTREIVRRYVLDNARYWLEQFRFDGLRLDAVHAIVDPSPRHVLRELADQVSGMQPGKLLIAEDDRNDPGDVTEHRLHAIWADDFHHQLRVTLTGERDGYYRNYEPGVTELAITINSGWLYAGQRYPVTGKPRGKPATSLSAEQFVYCIQNHDQIGNRALGERLTRDVSPEAYAIASMLLLSLPMTPLLFMGQEWAASAPFLYFTDHEVELGRLVSEGRRAEFAGFEAFTDERRRELIPDPQAPATFERSRLDWSERELPEQQRVLELYRSLLALRRSDPVLRDVERSGLRAEALGSLLLVHFGTAAGRRLLAINFGDEPASAELLAKAVRSSGPCRSLLTSDLGEWSGTLTRHRGVLLTYD